MERRKTRQISIGPVKIGGEAPISVQSMTKTDTRDVRKTVHQIRLLEEAGCEIIRVAVVDEEAARAIAEIKKKIRIPLIADIHFHPRLALLAMESGADGSPHQSWKHRRKRSSEAHYQRGKKPLLHGPHRSQFRLPGERPFKKIWRGHS